MDELCCLYPTAGYIFLPFCVRRILGYIESLSVCHRKSVQFLLRPEILKLKQAPTNNLIKDTIYSIFSIDFVLKQWCSLINYNIDIKQSTTGSLVTHSQYAVILKKNKKHHTTVFCKKIFHARKSSIRLYFNKRIFPLHPGRPFVTRSGGKIT